MIVEELSLPGLFLVQPEPHADERGFFARTHCEEEFAGHGLIGRFAQSSVSFNHRRGTVRGMHFSREPHAETKLVRCTSGAIHDAVVDLRPGSPTYLRTEQVTLSARNRHALYIPAGLAHGFQTLMDETEILYMIDRPFVATAADGLRWNDPAFALSWPEPVTVIAARDLAFPDWAGR
ncbi:dTDP-4-dehydrorhamnose 3,5-epimerase family protein [Methylorubrum populi]